MSSREAIIGRIRSALADVPQVSAVDDVEVSWRYGLRPEGAADDMLGLFVERVEDYRRLRDEVELGFKQVKWVQAVEFVASFRVLGSGEGGFNEDHEFFGYRAPI